jgi:hypothetical protein
MGLIKEFELHIKYSEGFNIIFCGSLNFKLNPIKMINNHNRLILYNTVKKYIENNYQSQISELPENSNPENSNPENSNPENNLMKYNELHAYLDKLISNLNYNNSNIDLITKKEKMIEKNNTKLEKIVQNISPGLYITLKTTNQLYYSLLTEFRGSIDKIGIKLTCDYSLSGKKSAVFHPLKMGSLATKYVKAFNKGHAVYKESNNTKLGSVIAAPKAVGVSIASFATSLAKPITKKLTKKEISDEKKYYKLPSMCDRILFSLNPPSLTPTPRPLNPHPLYFIEFTVFDDVKLKKSSHNIVYSIFSFSPGIGNSNGYYNVNNNGYNANNENNNG